MIAAAGPERRGARLMTVAADAAIRHRSRADLPGLFRAGDLVVANDAAVLPASLGGVHAPTGRALEVRLAAWVRAGDPTRFVALVFGAGDHRVRTEDRPDPPALAPGDGLRLGPLAARVVRTLDHPRLVELAFEGDRAAVLAGLARHGRPIQYAHVPAPLALWDVWPSLAAAPMAFEAPSAGFAIDWATLASWRRREVRFATLTHAAGVSSTGDPELDLRLPFDEPYVMSKATAEAVRDARARGGRVLAIGTTVVRALESAAHDDGTVRAGAGLATGRIGRGTALRVVDGILTGVHEPGESHFELLRAFAADRVLDAAHAEAIRCDYRTHEFGDSMLLARGPVAPTAPPPPASPPPSAARTRPPGPPDATACRRRAA